MAGDTEQLVVSLEARIREFERNFQRARRTANDNFTGIENRARRAGRNLETAMADSSSRMARSFSKLGTTAGTALRTGLSTALAPIVAGLALNQLRKVADEYTKIMNTLSVAGVSRSDLPQTFDRLFQSAQRNAAPLDALATLYGRVSAAQTTLKASSQEVMQVTDITAKALRVGGTSATEASGALLQLGQALAGGKVQAEEYNSLLDGMRPLLEAAAEGLSEAGGDVAKLTALVKDGKVSSEAFFRAIIAGSPILEEKLSGAAVTTEQAMQRLQNEFVKAVGEFDKATGASQALAGAIDGLAGSIGGIGSAATSAVTGVQALINKVGELVAANAGLQRQQALTYQNERANRVAQAREMGLANSGGRDKLAQERAAADAAAQSASRQAVAGFRQSEIDFANRLTTTTLPPARPKGAGSSIKPVSLKDFEVPGDSSSSGRGGGSGGAEKQSRFDREIDSIKRRTEALRLEADMVGKSKLESERAKIALQLEQAVRRDGVAITDQMRTAIDAAANGYANAKLKVEDLKNSMEGAKESAKFFGDQITDGLTDMILEGKSATEVIQSLGKALLKAAIQGALMGSGPFGKLFGGGLFGALFGGFAEGGYTGDGGKYQPAGIVHRGEFVMSKAATQRIGVGNLDRMHRGALRGYADGGFVGAAPMPVPTPARSSGGISMTNNVTVQVQGSTGDARKDAAYGDQIAKRVSQELRSLVGSEIAKQLRPGGIIREAGR